MTKPACENHDTKVPYYSDNWESLAAALGELRYKELAEFLGALSEKISRDSDKDCRGNRDKLAKQLSDAAINIKKAEVNILEAWGTCKPYMKNNQ